MISNFSQVSCYPHFPKNIQGTLVISNQKIGKIENPWQAFTRELYFFNISPKQLDGFQYYMYYYSAEIVIVSGTVSKYFSCNMTEINPNKCSKERDPRFPSG